MNQGVNFDDHDGQGDTIEGNPLSATLSDPIDRDVCSEHLTISGSHVSMHLTLDGKEENNLVNDATRSNGKEVPKLKTRILKLLSKICSCHLIYC